MSDLQAILSYKFVDQRIKIKCDATNRIRFFFSRFLLTHLNDYTSLLTYFDEQYVNDKTQVALSITLEAG